MTTHSNDHLRVELDERVLTATLCRGEVGNGMDRVLADALLAWAHQTLNGAASGEVRVAVLRNEGFAFCVGGDLAHFTQSKDRSAELRYVAETIHEALRLLAAAPVPVVTVVDGVAAGGGVGLALIGDIIVGTAATKFKMAYTDVGLSPDCGGSWLLTRRVGVGRALELSLTNRIVGVEEARAIGLVGPVGGDDLNELVSGLVGRLARGSSDSIATTKRLTYAAATNGLSEHLDDEAISITRLSGSPDGREGLNAFIEKRQPVFE
jgi:2-(1,2-epoxy-1,2-dihydrophenyl)acetyl-CoA isomerase